MTVADADLGRVLHWEGCYNVRDLGGLATSDGRRVRWGAVVRSDILSRLTDRGRKSLVDHGVRTIVDLRFADEIAVDLDSYPFRDRHDAPIRYSNVPFDTGGDPERLDERRAAYDAARSRIEFNRLDLDWGRGAIAAAVVEIVDAPDGGVLVHCHAGKDRTGAVVAVLLSMLGVSDDEIADDYAMTAITLEPLIVEWLDGTTADEVERDRLRALAVPAREAMLDTLAYLRQRYGSAEAYLLGGGVTADQLVTLRTRLLEDA